jgi:hypothetical protein
VQDSNRRDFLRSSAAAVAASRLSANDRIRVAVIGLRGRGRELINSFHEAVRSRKPGDLTAEARELHLSAALPHLANIAYRTGRMLQFDPQKERFIGDEEANRLLTRNYRAPYLVREKV